jgi:hypothetical protein
VAEIQSIRESPDRKVKSVYQGSAFHGSRGQDFQSIRSPKIMRLDLSRPFVETRGEDLRSQKSLKREDSIEVSGLGKSGVL